MARSGNRGEMHDCIHSAMTVVHFCQRRNGLAEIREVDAHEGAALVDGGLRLVETDYLPACLDQIDYDLATQAPSSPRDRHSHCVFLSIQAVWLVM